MTRSYPSFDGVSAGLCAACRHARAVPTVRGRVFLLCDRARSEPQYPRYPRLPMVRCAGFDIGDVQAIGRGDEEREGHGD